MNCAQTRSRLIDLLYNELDEPTTAAAQRHLASCPRCAAERAALERTRDALDAWTPVKSPDGPRRLAALAADRVGVGRRSVLHRAGPWLQASLISFGFWSVKSRNLGLRTPIAPPGMLAVAAVLRKAEPAGTLSRRLSVG